MAGAGAKLFVSGAVLTAAQVNTFLMDQTVMVFATTADRDAAFGGAGEPTLAEGMFAITKDTDTLWYYTGAAWVGRSIATGDDRKVLTADSASTGGLKYNYPSDAPTVRSVSNTTNFVQADAGGLVSSTGSAITLQCPSNATVPIAIGTQINIVQTGTGIVTFNGAVGVTVNSFGNKLRTNGQYAVATVVKTATDTWLLLGNLQV